MAREIEILRELQSPLEEALQVVRNRYDHVETKTTRDVYLMDPMRPDLQPDPAGCLTHCLRVRFRGAEEGGALTHKIDIFRDDGTWSHSDELETSVSDAAQTLDILKRLGFRELVTVNLVKHVFRNSLHTVVLEVVENLGNFIEIEAVDSGDDPEVTLAGLVTAFDSLGLSTTRNSDAGKPEQLLRRRREESE